MLIRLLTISLLSCSFALAAPPPCAAQSSGPPEVVLTAPAVVEPLPIVEASASATVSVEFASSDERLVLYRAAATEGSSDAFTLVCPLPCTAEIAPGAYRFGTTRGGDDPRVVSEVVEIDRPGRWNVSFSDNSGLRTAGWATLLLGGVAVVLGPVLGNFVFPKTIDTSFGNFTTMNTELMLAFVFPGCAALLTGMVLAVFSYDGVTVDETGVRF